MSEGTTKPNGSREMEVQKDVESKEYFEKMENCELLNSTALLNLYIVN